MPEMGLVRTSRSMNSARVITSLGRNLLPLSNRPRAHRARMGWVYHCPAMSV